MNIRWTALSTLTLALTVAGLFTAIAAVPQQQRDRSLIYHDRPPDAPLPDTLDPETFQENRTAFASYTLASRIKEVLYQVPCYCPCGEKEGHQSLLDCYTSKHGVTCRICQKEAVFSYLQHKDGKTPAQIRKAMADGEAMRLDLDKEINRFYTESQAPKK
jgi:hypothetical protein